MPSELELIARLQKCLFLAAEDDTVAAKRLCGAVVRDLSFQLQKSPLKALTNTAAFTADLYEKLLRKRPVLEAEEKQHWANCATALDSWFPVARIGDRVTLHVEPVGSGRQHAMPQLNVAIAEQHVDVGELRGIDVFGPDFGPDFGGELATTASILNSKNSPPRAAKGSGKNSLDHNSTVFAAAGGATHPPWPDLAALSLAETPSSELDGFRDLYQDLLPNCSFVLALLAFYEAGHTAALRLLVVNFRSGPKPEHDPETEPKPTPQQATSEGPAELCTAKCRLYVHAAWRELALSLLLPQVSSPHENRSLVVRLASNRALWWPALLEKAYVAAMGHDYDVRGSNFAHDSYVLGGFWPETRRVGAVSHSELTDLVKLQKNGKLVLGLGTGPMSLALAAQLGLVANHDYVICGHDAELHVTRVKNPWVAKGTRGRVFDADPALLGLFSYLYVCWRPYLERRAMFTTHGAQLRSHVIAPSTQFVFLSLDVDADVAVVAERHLQAAATPPYCVMVFEAPQAPIVNPALATRVVESEPSEARVQLARFRARRGVRYGVVVVEPGSHVTEPATYFLLVHASAGTAKPLAPDLPHELAVPAAAWLSRTAGGNWASAAYVDNPQFDVVLPAGVGEMEILASTPTGAVDLAAHAFLIDESQTGKKIRAFDKLKLLYSPDYARVAHRRVKVQLPGLVRVVVLTYEPAPRTPFELTVRHDGLVPGSCTKVPEAWGTFVLHTDFAWGGTNRRKLRMLARHAGHVTLRVLSDASGLAYRPAVRASVFDAVSRQPVLVNENWSNLVHGCFADFDVDAGTYVVLVERFESGMGDCHVMVAADVRVELGDVPAPAGERR